MKPSLPKQSPPSIEEAKRIRKLFQEQILDTEAWRLLDGYVNFQVLREGRYALMEPETARARGDFVRGVEFIRTVLTGALEEIEVVEDSEHDASEDQDILALTSIGGGDPL